MIITGARDAASAAARQPLKNQRSRRLVSVFGTVEIRAPRFALCRCAVTCRRTLNPVAEIMPDRCMPEYERIVAKMGSLTQRYVKRHAIGGKGAEFAIFAEFRPPIQPRVFRARFGGKKSGGLPVHPDRGGPLCS